MNKQVLEEINDVETSVAYSNLVVLERTDFLRLFVENYRENLISTYKSYMDDAFSTGNSLDLMDEFISECAYIMQASDDVILSMFLDDADAKYAESIDANYFKALFKSATKFP